MRCTFYIVVCIFVLLITGCNNSSEITINGTRTITEGTSMEDTTKETNADGDKTGKSFLSLSDFSFLKLDISYNDVVKKVGEPTRTTGSGILMDVYDLKDGSYIILNYGPKRNALKIARLAKSDGTYEDLLK